MKWVEAVAVECRGDAKMVLEKLTARGVSQNTINDQMRRLKNQGLVSTVPDHASNDVVVASCRELIEKPFNPVPKSRAVKKKS